MLNKSELLFVGIGQAGNNLVSEVLRKNKRYNGLFVNTSHDDVKAIDNAENVFIVPSAGGTARNRDRAQGYVKKHIQALVDKINEFPMQKVIYVCFSTGGGTGSGIAPLLINVLRKTHPNVIINIVAILPSLSESVKSLNNTKECWNEFIESPNINTIYALDNSSRPDKFELNCEFAELFDSFMDLTTASTKGVLDASEVESLATGKGFGAIYDLSNGASISSEMNVSIFAVGTTVAEYVGLAINDSEKAREYLDVFTYTIDEFTGATSGNPLLILGGATLNNKPLLKINDAVAEKERSIAEVSADIDAGSLKVKIDKPVKKKSEAKPSVKSVNIDELVENDNFWDDILNM